MTDRLSEISHVGQLALWMHVSPRTLARLFREELGTSAGAWLAARRISAARTLLEETDLPIDAIATRVGLGSALSLRRRFRQLVGTTPGAYRAHVRAVAQRSCPAGIS